MTEHIPLGAGREFDRIRKIWQALGASGTGGGDDCAIVEVGSELIAISVDSSVEGTHFERGWLSHLEMGRRAAAASLSDLAAVAADPRGVLVSLGVSPEVPDEFVSDIMEGVGDVAASVGSKVWGGDLYRSEKIEIGVTVVGNFDGVPMLRKGASIGDSIWVTGTLGGAAEAVGALQTGREPEESCRQKFVSPTPRIAHAKWIRDRGASAMIDVSDGIASDVTHVLTASGVAGVVDSEKILRQPGAESLDCELTGGEDYELLFTMPDGNNSMSDTFEKTFGIPLTKIGRVLEGTGLTILRDGVPFTPARGFRHF
jgi:thiamine-monophosphate kinase